MLTEDQMEVGNFPGGNAEDIIFDEKKVYQ